MTDQFETLTVLFADISDSTGIMKRYGDAAGRGIVQRCLARAATAVTRHDGRILGQIGDELMCAIPRARQAVLAGLDIQNQVAAGGRAKEYPAEVRMHIGLHRGPVVLDDGQIFGDTIHTAKRMVDLAKPDQILTTRDTLETAGSIPGVQWRRVDRIRIKGYEKPVAIFEVIRQDSNATILAPRAAAPCTGEYYLGCTLRYGTRSYLLDASRPILTIGREKRCDLLIAQSCVSREHGRLEYQKGRIIFVDHSTNGTYVSEENAPALVLVHREQRWLRNRGLLRFGSRDDRSGRLSVGYRCETAAQRVPP